MPFIKSNAFPASLAALTLAACLLSPSIVEAADPPLPCGETGRDALAAAEKAISSKDPNAQGLALQCLLQAVKELDALMPIRRSYETPQNKK